MELEDFLSRLDGVKQLPSGFSARCPAHDDHVSSLSINAGREGGIVVMCHAGCRTEDVVSTVGLEMGDLAGRPHITAEYPYFTEEGVLLYTVERWVNPKTFRCRPGLPAPARRVLYRTDALTWAREHGATVYITEGEKDANRLASLGLVSTTNVGGAGAWLPHYGQALEGCPVIVLADTDDVGIAHARAVALAIREQAAMVRILMPRHGKDVSELLDLGWTLEDLEPVPEPGKLGLILASNVIIRPVLWVWPGYIPAGKVTMIEGDPGDGKSILTTDLAARWSSGSPLPDGERLGRPLDVIMISAEDDPEDTIVPRLSTAGADLNRVHLGIRGADPSRPFTLSRDLPALAEEVLAFGAGVITLDPLMALLGDDVDAHSDHSIRRALWPLHQLAQDTGVAVVVVRHLNKGTGKAVYRGGGSIGIGGAARAVYNVGRDPENPHRRVFANVKMNIAKEPDSLAYSVEHGMNGPYIEWHGVIDASAQEIVDGHYHNEDDADIIYFLNSVVENGEPLKWHDIVLAGRREGYTEKQLRSRRNRSRLVKIVGHEGNRSVRWGYLEHTLTHLPELDPSSPVAPLIPLPLTHPPRADGPAALPPPTQGQGNPGGRGGQWVDDGQMGETEEERRETELHERPLVCEICQTEAGVSRYARPWWVIRCIAHSPLSYQA